MSEITQQQLFKWPLFPGRLGYIQSDNIKGRDIERILVQWGMADPDHNFADFDYDSNDGGCYDLDHNSLIVMPDSDNDVSVLVHECLHAALNLMRSVGACDDETLCYLTQWAFNQILPFWMEET